MEPRVCVHISGRKAYLCTIRILHESSTFAGHDGTQHKREPGLFRGPSTEKRLPIRKTFSISVQNSANLASSGIQEQHHQAQDESTENLVRAKSLRNSKLMPDVRFRMY